MEKWKRQQEWLDQFAESTQKQNEQREAQTKPSNPWKKTLPITFYWSPEIAQTYKKTEGWKVVQSIANSEFEATLNRTKQKWGKVPASDMSLVVYLQKQKAKGKPLSPADEKFLNACQPNKPKQDKWKLPPAAEKNEEANKKQERWNKVNNIANYQFQLAIKGLKHDEWKPPPGAETYEKNEAAIAKSVYGPWPFDDLPEKVCSLAPYCRKRKQKGLPLTAAQKRFFAQLVNVYHEPELPKCHEQFLEGLKQGATIRSVYF